MSDDRKPLLSDDEARMYRAFLAMPELRRAVFFGHRVDDLAYRELARKHGISVSRVEREIAAAMRDMDPDRPNKRRWRWPWRRR